jgi:chitin disaccharide deacetylase
MNLSKGPVAPNTARWLIVTADDFGLSREVNAGVISAFRDGVLKGTSLMVAGSASIEAAELAKQHPGLDVGLHLVLTRGCSVLPPDRLGGITDAASRFADKPTAAGIRYFFDRRIRIYLRDEIRAQIEKHLLLIGRLEHLDGHLNIHVHPVVGQILIELAGEYQINYMRLPREPVFTTLRLAHDHAGRKLLESVIFKALSRRMYRMMTAKGIRTTDWLFGLHQTGYITEDYVAGVIVRLKPGSTEMYFHPAAPFGTLSPVSAAATELKILTSDRMRAAVMKAGVRLTNFAEMVRSSTSSLPREAGKRKAQP